MWKPLLESAVKGDFRALARCITMIENEGEGYEAMMESLPAGNKPVIGITGPPGAGKSTITDRLISAFTEKHNKVAVLCIDPSSPFNNGAVLGDRIRMNAWYNSPDVYIRSLATRGSLGGLHPKIIEITDLLKASVFDIVIIETVGVGQSEVEIAGLADTTVVVIVPESGDEIQTMKAGLMEIADIFVINKSDRPGADALLTNLHLMLAPAFTAHEELPVIKTIASEGKGISELAEKILDLVKSMHPQRKNRLLAEKAYHLIQSRRMRDIDKKALLTQIENAGSDFNLYRFAKKY